MKKKSLLVAFIGSIFLVSCSSEDSVLPESQNSKIENGLDETLVLVKKFAADHPGDQLTKATDSEIEVLNYDVQTYTFDLTEEVGDIMQTKADGGISNQVNIYTIKFKKGDNQGYTIATSDERLNKVYAYVEKGDLSDTTRLLGLRAFLSYIPDKCKSDLIDYYKPTTKATPQKAYKVNPVTNLTWDQTFPYNKFAPLCSSGGDGGHMWAGCTSIAVAQAMAAIKPAALQKAYNLYNLKNSYGYYTTDPTVDDCARLIYMINAKLGSNYGCSGTGAHLRNIRGALDEWGVKYTYKQDKNVDENYLLNCLNYGRPHMTRGERKKPREGHAWLWTGIDCVIDASSVAPNLRIVKLNSVYCNWGWGGRSNGWFASYEQPDSNKQPFLDNNDQIYILSSGR